MRYVIVGVILLLILPDKYTWIIGTIAILIGGAGGIAWLFTSDTITVTDDDNDGEADNSRKVVGQARRMRSRVKRGR